MLLKLSNYPTFTLKCFRIPSAVSMPGEDTNSHSSCGCWKTVVCEWSFRCINLPHKELAHNVAKLLIEGFLAILSLDNKIPSLLTSALSSSQCVHCCTTFCTSIHFLQSPKHSRLPILDGKTGSSKFCGGNIIHFIKPSLANIFCIDRHSRPLWILGCPIQDSCNTCLHKDKET